VCLVVVFHLDFLLLPAEAAATELVKPVEDYVAHRQVQDDDDEQDREGDGPDEVDDVLVVGARSQFVQLVQREYPGQDLVARREGVRGVGHILEVAVAEYLGGLYQEQNKRLHQNAVAILVDFTTDFHFPVVLQDWDFVELLHQPESHTPEKYGDRQVGGKHKCQRDVLHQVALPNHYCIEEVWSCKLLVGILLGGCVLEWKLVSQFLLHPRLYWLH